MAWILKLTQKAAVGVIEQLDVGGSKAPHSRTGESTDVAIPQTAAHTSSKPMSGKKKCWVWCRNGLNQDSCWKSGWTGSPSPLGGIRLESYDFVPCRVPEWRVSWDEPSNKGAGPDIPDGAEWKLFPTD